MKMLTMNVAWRDLQGTSVSVMIVGHRKNILNSIFIDS